MKKNILTSISLFGVLMLLATITPVSANGRTIDRSNAIDERLEVGNSIVSERLHQIINRFKEGTSADEHSNDSEHGDEADHDSNDGEVHHTKVEAVEPIPTIDLIVHEDSKSGYNLQVLTTNYKFAPEHASTQHSNGEGHAHLYIDGEKVTRLYGEWFYVKALEPGQHSFRVELSANDHRAYAHEEELIDDMEMVIVE